MAERFRDLVRPTLVDVGARSTRSGGSEAALAVADALGAFQRTAHAVGVELQTQRGAKEGAAAGTSGDPDFRSGLRGMSAYGKAYNNAALRSYAIRSELDLKTQAARLEEEAGTNPEAFLEAMEEIRKSTLAEAPPEAHQILEEAFAQRTAEGAIRVQSALSAELRAEDRGLVNEQVEQLIESVSTLRSKDTEASHAESVHEEARLQILLDAAAADGVISESEKRVALRDAQHRIVSKTIRSRFANELNDPFADPIGFLQDLKDAAGNSKVLPPDQEEKLINQLMSDLREHNALASAEQSRQVSEEKTRFDAGEKAATVGILSGAMGTNDLVQMVADGDLDPAIARTLHSVPGSVKSDPETLLSVSLNALTLSEQDILQMDGLTHGDKLSIIQQRRDDVQGWKGTQRAKEGAARIDRALGIVPGTPMFLLSEEQRTARDSALTDWYDRVDSLDPELRDTEMFAVTDQVIRDNIKQQAETELQQNRAAQRRIELRLQDSGLDEYTRRSSEETLQRLQLEEQKLSNKSQ